MVLETGAAPAPLGAGVEQSAFHVHLDIFDGPFDLLLSLIAKRRLDVTLVAIAQVTDEFISYIRACRRTTGTSTRPASSSWSPPRCST